MIEEHPRPISTNRLRHVRCSLRYTELIPNGIHEVNYWPRPSKIMKKNTSGRKIFLTGQGVIAFMNKSGTEVE
jgi:hypothetical protein